MTLFLAPFSFVSFGQDSLILKKDSIRYQHAIYWAKKGDRDQAKKICLSILTLEPHQVRTEILLGRLYSWGKQYDSAGIFLKDAHARQPDNEEASKALINLELWSGHLDQALGYCDSALSHHPNSESLLIKKAKIYNKQGKFKEAYGTVQQVLRINPNNLEAIEFEKYLRLKMGSSSGKASSSGANGIGIYYQYDHFDNALFAPWHYTSVYFFHKSKGYHVSASINYANRFQTSALQYDLNLGLKISPSMKLLLEGAYSKDSILPGWNLGAALSHTLFQKGELEGGVRYLSFYTLPDPLWVYTGAFSWSFPRLRLSARAFFTKLPAGMNESYYLTARYYTKNPMRNISLTLNTGSIPHDYIDPSSGKAFNYSTRSERIRVGYQTPFLSSRNIFKCSLGYEERKYYAANALQRVTAGVGVERLF